MTRSFLSLIRVAFLLSALLPLVVTAYGDASMHVKPTMIALELAIGFAFILAVNELVRRGLQRLEPEICSLGRGQVEFVDRIRERYIGISIMGSAALSLLLELAMIRWQGTVWEFFAFYKNLGLLACFAGLGMGYALAKREEIHVALVTPLLAFQMLLLISLRHGLSLAAFESLRVTPFREQLNMGLDITSSFSHAVTVYFFLSVVFLLTALTFIPVGQLCGRLLMRTNPLRAYRLNLFGSLLGVGAMLALSFLWTPPVIWFLVAVLVIAFFQVFDRRALLTGLVATLGMTACVVWPVSTGSELIYSPYQLLERRVGSNGQMVIVAAGHYYQHVYDLSSLNQMTPAELRSVGNYYDFPYRLRSTVGRVAVVGAGTGNDVAAALRAGAEQVDAIEIDPAILALGAYHPEHPYRSPRVRTINNDARSFLRSTTAHYDLIVYGLLDSHTLLSQNSSVRLDSFVYTVEGFQEARAHLNEGGILSLSFSTMPGGIDHKMYLMMEKAFDGHPPICIWAGYDSGFILLQSKDGDLRVPPSLITASRFSDVTKGFSDPTIRADVSTDDWPFLYMPRRIYPASYLFMAGLVLFLSITLFRNFLLEGPRLSHASFFFLGAGFMLIETKGITEMGLTFGNTWQVIGIVIASILIMSYLANGVVQALGLRSTAIPYALLLSSVGLGLAISKSGGLAPSLEGKLLTAIVLTSPIFFAGTIFSTLIKDKDNIAGAMASNLFGAIVGGLLEYNSMYFGFHFLYWLAGGLYLAAWCSSLTFKRAMVTVPA